MNYFFSCNNWNMQNNLQWLQNSFLGVFCHLFATLYNHSSRTDVKSGEKVMSTLICSYDEIKKNGG